MNSISIDGSITVRRTWVLRASPRSCRPAPPLRWVNAATKTGAGRGAEAGNQADGGRTEADNQRGGGRGEESNLGKGGRAEAINSESWLKIIACPLSFEGS